MIVKTESVKFSEVIREELVKGVPSMTLVRIPDDAAKNLPPLIRATKRMQYNALREIKEFEESIMGLGDFDYDGECDEDGWSEEDHQLWKTHMMMAGMMMKMIKQKWERYQWLLEVEKKQRAKIAHA